MMDIQDFINTFPKVFRTAILNELKTQGITQPTPRLVNIAINTVVDKHPAHLVEFILHHGARTGHIANTLWGAIKDVEGILKNEQLGKNLLARQEELEARLKHLINMGPDEN